MEKIDSIESSFWDFKGLADSTDKRFLMSSPFPVIFILLTYLWLVLKLGPEFMKNRKPYKLDRVLTVYNLIQVLVSCYILAIGLYVMPLTEAIQIARAKCYSEIQYVQLTDCTHCYLLAKIVELLDTVFFVLRKKQRQVSFLHVYHHTIMVVCTWCVVKYSASDSVVFIGLTNSIIHVIMYSYYGLSVFPALTKYLWWKKYITIMQLVQFCLMFLNIVMSHFVSECKKSYILLSAVSFNTVLFFYLFGDFYIKSYTKEKNADMGSNTEKATEEIPNGDTKKGHNYEYMINRRKLAANIN